MKYITTRNEGAETFAIADAIRQGAAPDGGLFIPASFPSLDIAAFDNADGLKAIAETLLAPFFEGDRLAPDLGAICASAYNFPAPLKPVGDDGKTYVLELFHGPTGAFKDYGARFLAAAMERLRAPGAPLTVLAATSGDTGGAVGGAFEDKEGVHVGILFPKGRISPFQEHQLTCWRGGVKSFAVNADFDACQALVKQAFADKALTEELGLTSANSINLGRLMPQMGYYAESALKIWRAHGQKANYIIPTGNLGNAVACVWARGAGLPIGKVILATNANKTLEEFFATGAYEPRPSVATLANAMDVGAPNNFDRLKLFLTDDLAASGVSAASVDDATIQARIKTDYAAYDEVWCPHTATAAEILASLSDEERAAPWIIAATAHPYKFRETVEPLIGRDVDCPPAFRAILDREAHAEEITADLGSLAQGLRR